MSNTYELRTYQAFEGRMDEVLTRFRDHTVFILPDYGMQAIGYWVSKEDPNRLVYIVRHEGDADENWAGFRADPRWIKARDESHVNGVLTESIVAERLEPTDFSALQ
ncbi:MAG: NIPSNAP family protein [Microbacteriaceae bacterium]